MDGFDARFADFPDFILGVTREIWEERRVGSLRRYYAPGILVRSPDAFVEGSERVIAATLATQAEFPDRVLYGEDVIWCGSPNEGMLSSHRIVSEATHAGAGVFGPACGRQVRYRVIADCHARANQIDDEWLVRDLGAMVRQLGWKPRDYARRRIAEEGGPERCAPPFHPDLDRAGPYAGRGNDDPWGETLAGVLERHMEGDFSVAVEEYDRACRFCGAPGREGYSHETVGRFWLELRAAFPSARFSIDHQMGREDEHMPPRAAVRWSLLGRHDGHGLFGPPSGAEVYVMGMTHAEFGPRGVRFECSLYDEVAVWKQILLAAGDSAPGGDLRGEGAWTEES